MDLAGGQAGPAGEAHAIAISYPYRTCPVKTCGRARTKPGRAAGRDLAGGPVPPYGEEKGVAGSRRAAAYIRKSRPDFAVACRYTSLTPVKLAPLRVKAVPCLRVYSDGSLYIRYMYFIDCHTYTYLADGRAGPAGEARGATSFYIRSIYTVHVLHTVYLSTHGMYTDGSLYSRIYTQRGQVFRPCGWTSWPSGGGAGSCIISSMWMRADASPTLFLSCCGGAGLANVYIREHKLSSVYIDRI